MGGKFRCISRPQDIPPDMDDAAQGVAGIKKPGTQRVISDAVFGQADDQNCCQQHEQRITGCHACKRNGRATVDAPADQHG